MSTSEFKYPEPEQYRVGSSWTTVVDIAEIMNPFFMCKVSEYTFKAEHKDKEKSQVLAIAKAKKHYEDAVRDCKVQKN